MLCLILIVGGLLIMMGQHDRSEALFYYFRLEDQVPETHLLRLIEKHISFDFVREKLKASYSDMGRPSIGPELLLRILLIGYLYGITSEGKLGGVSDEGKTCRSLRQGQHRRAEYRSARAVATGLRQPSWLAASRDLSGQRDLRNQDQPTSAGRIDEGLSQTRR
jgi:hypothetical protein